MTSPLHQVFAITPSKGPHGWDWKEIVHVTYYSPKANGELCEETALRFIFSSYLFKLGSLSDFAVENDGHYYQIVVKGTGVPLYAIKQAV